MGIDAVINPGLTPEKFLTALEANMFEFYAGYARSPNSELYQDASYLRVFTGLPYAMFNGIFGAQLTPGTLDGAISDVIDYMANKKVPCCWYVTPGVRPAGLSEHLKRHGFTFGGFSPGMWIELDAISENQMIPPRLDIGVVEDGEMVKTWTEVVWPAMGFSEAGRQRFLEMENFLGIDPQSHRLRYLAYLNGKPVATSLLLLHAGVAGIYAVSTLPEARGKGIGGAITLAPLRQARDRGYHIGTLQASRMGFPVYRRLGFQEVFQVQEYEWKPQ